MENTFPISNVSLLFTQYRTQVLEDTGRKWFFPENGPQDLLVAPQDNGAATDAITNTADTPAVEVIVSSDSDEPKTAVSVVAPTIELVTEAYDHPDPWENSDGMVVPSGDKIEALPLHESVLSNEAISEPTNDLNQSSNVAEIETSQEAVDIQPPVSGEANEEREETVRTRAEASVSETDKAESNGGKNVNLFPFESQSVDGVYDLTEFDNGEFEVPPVAVRDRKTASFEKLNAIAPQSSEAVEPPTEVEENPSSGGGKKKKKNNASSADIAKYRLRNIV